MKREDNERLQQGTGSAENTGEDREVQKNQMFSLNKEKRKNIARQGGLGRKRITDPNNLGALSERDDYADSSDDDMSDQSTEQPAQR